MSQKGEKYARRMERRVDKLEQDVAAITTEQTTQGVRISAVEDDLAVYRAAVSARELKQAAAEIKAAKERRTARKYETSVTERARRERWQASGCARVVSRKYGTVVVPHGSNFAALLNAAEVWGCDWTEIRDAEVWRADKEERPVPMPHLI